MVLRTPTHRPTPVHVQKRRGEHHRSTTKYIKTYWPYLPMALIVGLGVLLQASWSRPAQVLGVSSDFSATALLQETNMQRSQAGDAPLTLNSHLQQAAQAKADDMAQRNYWSHTTPDGQQPWSFITQAGYHYQQVGENLAYGFADSHQTVMAWRNSPEHRVNLLGNYHDVGFGVAYVPSFQGKQNQTVIVAMYGTPDVLVTAESARTGVAAESPQTFNTDGQVLPASTRHITRLETLFSGVNRQIAIATAILGSAALCWIILKHGRMWRRAVDKGELFIVRHPVLDIAVVGAGMLGYVLTRATGFIH